MSPYLVTGSLVLPFTSAADLSGSKGVFVKRGSSDSDVAVVASATADKPLGAVLVGQVAGQFNSIALPCVQGLTNLLTNAAAGTIQAGTDLVLCADGTVKADPGSGARWKVATAYGSAGNSEYVRALIIPPVYFAS